MLAHQLGFPLPTKVTSGIWNWEKLMKECGEPDGPENNRSVAPAADRYKCAYRITTPSAPCASK